MSRAKVVNIDADLPEVKPEPRAPRSTGTTPAKRAIGSRTTPAKRNPPTPPKATRATALEEAAITEAIESFHRQADAISGIDPLAPMYRMAANNLITALRNTKGSRDLTSRVKALQAKFSLLAWELGQVEESLSLFTNETKVEK